MGDLALVIRLFRGSIIDWKRGKGLGRAGDGLVWFFGVSSVAINRGSVGLVYHIYLGFLNFGTVHLRDYLLFSFQHDPLPYVSTVDSLLTHSSQLGVKFMS